MNDYERVANVIRFLNQNHTAQPDLAELADQAGLSPFHFHRLFSTWAGITPKDFLQCLTLEHIKALLHSGESVLDAAFDAGLSGPGRAHDLCVTLEAASPGELKTGGRGLAIVYGFAPTPFGEALIAETPRGICHLSFVAEDGRESALRVLRKQWSNAALRCDEKCAAAIAAKIFHRNAAASAPLRAHVHGTPFQVRVWRALLAVPAGTLTSYGRLAHSVGLPRASRAVGTAVGANPIAYIVPCHRVIRETGAIGNYRWDPTRKRAMLGYELAGTRASNGIAMAAASGW